MLIINRDDIVPDQPPVRSILLGLVELTRLDDNVAVDLPEVRMVLEPEYERRSNLKRRQWRVG